MNDPQKTDTDIFKALVAGDIIPPTEVIEYLIDDFKKTQARHKELKVKAQDINKAVFQLESVMQKTASELLRLYKEYENQKIEEPQSDKQPQGS